MINVCDQVVERSSKILAQRSKSVAAKLITTKELKDLGKLIDILAAETLAMTGKMSAGEKSWSCLTCNLSSERLQSYGSVVILEVKNEQWLLLYDHLMTLASY